MNKQDIKELIIAVIMCVAVLFAVIGFVMLKLDFYGGDPACFFVRCVKVIK